LNALIAYDSQFGNTKRITRAIAELLGSAQLIRAEEAGALEKFRVIPFFLPPKDYSKIFPERFLLRTPVPLLSDKPHTML
jgi:flavodoxin